MATYHAQRSRRRRTTLDLGGTVNAAALCVTWRRRGWGVTRLYRWMIDVWISMYLCIVWSWLDGWEWVFLCAFQVSSGDEDGWREKARWGMRGGDGREDV